MAVSLTADAVACSACAQTKPSGETFVDFGAENDQGSILVNGEVATIDDLKICGECMRAACGEMGYVPEDRDTIGRLTAELDQARQAAEAWKHYAERAEEAQAYRPEPVKRGPGRPPKKPEEAL